MEVERGYRAGQEQAKVSDSRRSPFRPQGKPKGGGGDTNRGIKQTPGKEKSFRQPGSGKGKKSPSSSQKPKPHREIVRTTPVFSWYWWVWRSSTWEVFLDGSQFRDFKSAKKGEASSTTKDLLPRPGCYEFALAHPNDPSKRFKVYVGYSSNIQKRHHLNYQRDGSHLLPQLERSLKEEYIVLRRVTYCQDAEKAKALESKLLRTYDYPWNLMENGGKRHVSLVQKSCCLCFRLPVTVDRRQQYAC
ncbi:GIY-YIG domain-containing protein [Chloropicon primus]|uniref:GIY-YIG domain-containing protein n=1 Tax=Chloropicon primus TaxID=1764295 RepID=A0A5B8MQL1_9CHLO|nr:hypothetical protein A3770_06p41880 [Chloropicon primus]UPR00892.1 GIY-YIG domain-containing protein [Chloropicon primus]|mmetsp:Transcript_12160/g.33723  ORF Transcript_12160/g.33723 Transcript_12160/m.33723 type:complete len:246 (+) Transcript_12160:163-900(+)|eukprot:QDZ21670.1 hypothetical protein A3770_06p41880 [Chloropicon primus]